MKSESATNRRGLLGLVAALAVLLMVVAWFGSVIRSPSVQGESNRVAGAAAARQEPDAESEPAALPDRVADASPTDPSPTGLRLRIVAGTPERGVAGVRILLVPPMAAGPRGGTWRNWLESARARAERDCWIGQTDAAGEFERLGLAAGDGYRWVVLSEDVALSPMPADEAPNEQVRPDGWIVSRGAPLPRNASGTFAIKAGAVTTVTTRANASRLRAVIVPRQHFGAELPAVRITFLEPHPHDRSRTMAFRTLFSGHTDQDGNVELRCVPPGRVRVEARWSEVGNEWCVVVRHVEILADEDLDLGSLQVAEGVAFRARVEIEALADLGERLSEDLLSTLSLANHVTQGTIHQLISEDLPFAVAHPLVVFGLPAGKYNCRLDGRSHTWERPDGTFAELVPHAELRDVAVPAADLVLPLQLIAKRRVELRLEAGFPTTGSIEIFVLQPDAAGCFDKRQTVLGAGEVVTITAPLVTTRCVVTVDAAERQPPLVGACDLPADQAYATVQLGPGRTATGELRGADGQPLPKRLVGLGLRGLGSRSLWHDETDDRGGFEVRGLLDLNDLVLIGPKSSSVEVLERDGGPHLIVRIIE